MLSMFHGFRLTSVFLVLSAAASCPLTGPSCASVTVRSFVIPLVLLDNMVSLNLVRGFISLWHQDAVCCMAFVGGLQLCVHFEGCSMQHPAETIQQLTGIWLDSSPQPNGLFVEFVSHVMVAGGL